MNSGLLKIAIKAAIEAGKEILDVYQTDFNVEFKGDKSPLTKADTRSHKCIYSYLKNTPYPMLSEEGKKIDYKERKSWKTFWIIDPLDGTKEFIKRNGEFTVNIALVKNNTPILGVIYVPVTGILYFSDENIGAFKEKNCIDTSYNSIRRILHKAVPIPIVYNSRSFTIISSRSHMSRETENFISELKKEQNPIKIISAGSSLKLCLVAEGLADVYPRFAPTMEWDTAAGQAICQAAGFSVINFETNTPLQYNKENLLNPWFIVK